MCVYISDWCLNLHVTYNATILMCLICLKQSSLRCSGKRCVQTLPPSCIYMYIQYSTITPILGEIHWFPIHSLQIILLTFKAVHRLAPIYLSELVVRYLPPRALRSVLQDLLVVNISRNKSYDRSIVLHQLFGTLFLVLSLLSQT